MSVVIMKNFKYKQWTCTLTAVKFNNGGVRFDLWDDEGPVATLNKWLVGLKPHQIALDVNNLGDEGFLQVVKQFEENNIIAGNPVRQISSGFCNYPVYALNVSIYPELDKLWLNS